MVIFVGPQIATGKKNSQMVKEMCIGNDCSSDFAADLKGMIRLDKVDIIERILLNHDVSSLSVGLGLGESAVADF